MATYSTLAEAKAGYLANSDYDAGSGDATKAGAFRTACRALLVLLPSTAASDRQSVSLDVGRVAAELDKVDAWIRDTGASAAPGGRVIYSDTRDFRQ